MFHALWHNWDALQVSDHLGGTRDFMGFRAKALPEILECDIRDLERPGHQCQAGTRMSFLFFWAGGGGGGGRVFPGFGLVCGCVMSAVFGHPQYANL